MKKQSPLFLKTSLKFGAVGGCLVSIFFLVIYFFDKNPLIAFREFYFGMLLLPMFIFFSIKEVRDYKNSGRLRFWQGLIVGFLTYVSMAFVFIFFVQFFVYYIDNQLMEDYIEDGVNLVQSMQEEITSRVGESEYKRILKEMKEVSLFASLKDFSEKVLISFSVIGLFLTILISVFLRK